MKRLMSIACIVAFACLTAQAQITLPTATPVQVPTPAPPETFGTPTADGGNLWNSTLMKRMGATMDAPNNQYGVTLQCFMAKTGDSPSYEKICLIPWVVQTDPSDYVNGLLHDGVPIDARCYIDGNNPSGRCWGAYFEVGAQPGSDGILSGVEIGGSNFGKDQPLPDQTNSKALFTLVAGEHPGNLNITGFGRMVPGTAKAYFGLIADSAAFVGDIEPAFGVRSSTNGLYINGLFPDGTVQGRHILQLINTPGLNAALLPTMKPGETFIWGDTSTGISYIAFYDGQGYSLWQVSKYITTH